MKKDLQFSESTGNVFADLGLPDAEQLRAKADLAVQIGAILDERKLTQAEAAAILGIDQPKVSALRRGRLTGFSMERLYRFLNALGNDIEITVRPMPRNRGHASVRVISARGTASHVAVRSAKPRSTESKNERATSAKSVSKRVRRSKQRT